MAMPVVWGILGLNRICDLVVDLKEKRPYYESLEMSVYERCGYFQGLFGLWEGANGT
jgi:hypothetical protein